MADIFGATQAVVEPLEGGGFLIGNAETLDDFPANIGTWVRQWAAERPERPFIAERDGAGWYAWSWAEAQAVIDRLSAGLLDLGLSHDRPLAILSEKSGRSGLLTFAAMQVGIPVAPLSPNWSLLPAAEARLRHALAVVQPGLIVSERSERYARALAICEDVMPSADIAVLVDPPDGRLGWPALTASADPDSVERTFAAVTPDTVGKIMFTSGSTGLPKAVQVTHGNMTSNQQAMRQMLPCLKAKPPVVVDWQPWHHCGGGCNNWHAAVANGGSYYCDPGRPTADGIAETVASLRDLSPTVHFNVPLGYDLLFTALAADEALRVGFFCDLDVLTYSAASMPDELWERAVRHARRPDGTPVPMISAYGMTEMAPMHTMVCKPMDEPNQIGIPAPGCRVRLTPFSDETGQVSPDRYVLEAQGPNIMSGYHRDEAATAAVYTDDGWFRSGDLVRFVDPSRRDAGLRLDGRAVEQFKLQSGTWVAVNEVRLALIAVLQPLVKDAIVAGEGRKEIGALLVTDPSNEMSSPEQDAWITDRLEAFNAGQTGSSRRVTRFRVLDAPLSIALGEITDKGSINQRLALANRAALVASMYDG